MSAGRGFFTVKVFKGEDGYFVAHCVELPGCASQGKTVREAKRNLQEALMLTLETLWARDGTGGVRSPTKRPVRVTRFGLRPLPT